VSSDTIAPWRVRATRENWRSCLEEHWATWNFTLNIVVVNATVAFDGSAIVGGIVEVQVRGGSENAKLPCSAVCLRNVSSFKVTSQ
jgi:hypothetical protein